MPRSQRSGRNAPQFAIASTATISCTASSTRSWSGTPGWCAAKAGPNPSGHSANPRQHSGASGSSAATARMVSTASARWSSAPGSAPRNRIASSSREARIESPRLRQIPPIDRTVTQQPAAMLRIRGDRMGEGAGGPDRHGADIQHPLPTRWRPRRHTPRPRGGRIGQQSGMRPMLGVFGQHPAHQIGNRRRQARIPHQGREAAQFQLAANDGGVVQPLPAAHGPGPAPATSPPAHTRHRRSCRRHGRKPGRSRHKVVHIWPAAGWRAGRPRRRPTSPHRADRRGTDYPAG